ncbi:acyltransferase [Mucilaginibacter sp. CSA2-8R]|uniref:acyltransferase n=1 Tax=Mucilaginibacter sp. CSA2-8R TaxID=3141542 RepID=UPI00315D15EE
MEKATSAKLRVLSFIAMIMIIYLHSYNLAVKFNGVDVPIAKNYNSFVQVFISDGITRIAVPLFAAISGFLFFYNFKPSTQAFLNKYKKRFNSLFIPYILWSAWGLLFFFILQILPQSRKFFNSTLIKDYSLNKLLEVLFWDPLPYQLWFVRDLLILVLLSPIIYLILRYLKIVGLLLFFVIWLFDFSLLMLKPDTIFFFSFGAYLSFHAQAFLQSRYPGLAKVALVLYIVLLMVKTWFFQINYTPNFAPFLLKGVIVCGAFAAWYLYDFVTENRDISNSTFYQYSGFSFFLYAFHEPVLTLFKKGTLAVIGKSQVAMFAAYLVLPLIVITLALITGAILKKYMSGFYSLLTGGR